MKDYIIKCLKNTLCSILILLILLTSVPLSGLMETVAANDSVNEIITGTGNKITRAQWLHNLAVVFEMSVEDEIYPDNYFSDLEATHKYYYDILLNVNFGVIDVEAGGSVNPDGLVTRAFASQTLNFCLGYQLEEDTYSFADAEECEYPVDAQVSVNRGWFTLVSGNFYPEKTITDAEVCKMMDDANNIVKSKVIDENYDSEYKFHSSVIEIPDGTEVVVEDNKVIITECREVIKKGSRFAVYQNSIPKIYEATGINVSGNITTVTVNPDFEGYDLFLAVDAEGITEASDFEITPDADTVMTIEEVPPEASLLQKTRGTIKLDKVYKFKKEIDLGNGASVSCNVKMENPKVEYRFSTSPVSARVVFDGDAEVSFNGSFDLLKSFDKDEIKIGTIGVPGIGGVAVCVDLSLEGSVGLATTGKLRFGFTYTAGSGLSTERNFKSKSFALTAEASGSAGLNLKFGITDAPVVNAYVYFKIGGKAALEISLYNDGVKPIECANFSAFLYCSFGVTVKIKVLSYSDSIDKSYTIWSVKNSPAKISRHYEDGKHVCTCARGGKIGYYTPWNSVYGCSGWLNGDNSTGYDREGKPYAIYKYTLDDDDNATITSYQGNATALYIPEKLDGHTVVAIGNNAFSNNYMYSVVIPDTVTEISAGAFLECNNLSSVQLSGSLKKMGAYAFGYCDSLRSINIPKSLEETYDAYYYNYVYGYCYGVFRGCDNLKEVTFEAGTTKVANGLFTGCTGLESINIPDTVVTIGFQAFAGCNNLSNIELSDNLVTIEDSAFRGTSINQIKIPDKVTTISAGAFADCINLSAIDLSESLATLGAYAFACCESLNNIEIPKSLKTTTDAYFYEYLYGYHHGPFFGCDNLKKITFEKGITEIPNGLFANNNGIEEIIIPDTVTKIKWLAFENCEKLKTVKFSESLITIESKAFRNTSIVSVDIPDSVSSIADGAFADCKNLSSVKLSKSLSTIGAYAFACCEALESIEIPKSLKTTTNAYYNEYIYNYHFGPFFGCNNLKTVTFEKGTTIIPQGLFANNNGLETIEIPETVTKIDYQAFLNCSNLQTVKLNEGLSEIAQDAFNKTSLKTISIPNTVVTIGQGAFVKTSLEKIVIPDSVTSLAKWCFQDCAQLESVKLSDNCSYIAPYVFENCISLTKIVLPESVTRIQDHAFKNCTSLIEVAFNDKITSIDSYAFENCDALEAIAVPNSVTSYGEGIFYDCDKLTSITLGTGMSSLPARTFEHCDAVESVVLPYRTSSIGNNSFKECVKLTSITIPRATTSIATSAFSYPSILTINGVKGTYAETFASEIGAKFVNKQVNATNVTVDKKTLTLNKGQSEKLVMTVTPWDFTDEVAWKSSDTDVVTVADDGTVTAKSVGTATIKITVGSVSTSFKVTVVQPVTGVYIDKSSVALEAYDTYQLNYSIYPDNAANKDIKWSSSDSDIASINENGLVTAYKKGKAIIKIEALDGSQRYDTCEIIVRNNGVIAESVSELESAHNYPVDCKDFWQYTLEGAQSVSVTFDSRTNIEDGFDYLYVFDGNKNIVGSYTGTELSGKTITINDDTVRIQLDSDNSGTEWGFKVTDVKAAAIHTHSYTSKITKVASCITTGTKTFTCTCGDSYTETIPATGHTKGSWITDKKATVNAPGSKHKECTECGETLETAKIAQLKPGRTTVKATTTSTGVKISWSKVTGADKYTVYRKTGSGSYKAIKTVTGTSYTDTTAKSGTKYKYNVKAKNEAGYGEYAKSGVTKLFLATPKVTVANASSGVTVKWNKITGAKGYYVYRKASGSSSWTKIATVKSGTTVSYTDKKASAGKKYYYTVKAYNGDYVSTTKASAIIERLKAPTIKSVTSGKSGVTVKWAKATGADGYYVYRKTGSGSYTKIATVKGNSKVSYLDKSAKKGKTYTYYVKAYSGKSVSTSSKTLKIKDKY